MRLENRAAGDQDNEQTPGIIDVVGNIMTFSYGMYMRYPILYVFTLLTNILCN